MNKLEKINIRREELKDNLNELNEKYNLFIGILCGLIFGILSSLFVTMIYDKIIKDLDLTSWTIILITILILIGEFIFLSYKQIGKIRAKKYVAKIDLDGLKVSEEIVKMMNDPKKLKELLSKAKPYNPTQEEIDKINKNGKRLEKIYKKAGIRFKK